MWLTDSRTFARLEHEEPSSTYNGANAPITNPIRPIPQDDWVGTRPDG